MEQLSIFDLPPVLLTIPEPARLLSIGRTLTYELISAGELEVVHINRAARIPLDAVEDFVKRQRTRPAVSGDR